MTNLVARQRLATIATRAATLWSTALALLIAPFANSLTGGDSARLYIALAVPVVVCLVAFAASTRRGIGWNMAIWCCVLLMCVFVFFTGFSIGLLYVPAVLALMYGAALASAE